MPDRLKVAVVGAGYFAQFQHEAWARMPQTDLVAISDLDGDKAQAAVASAGTGAAYNNLELMLRQARPDLIDIATPPASHGPLIAACRAAGLPVICQKPVADTAAEAFAIAKESGDHKIIIHENFRFQPWYREARRLIGDGQLGTLHSIAFRLRPGDGQGPDAYLARQPYFQNMRRFLVHETAIHFIDTFRYLCGEVSGVSARLKQRNPHINGEDGGYILFEFENGASGVFDGNRLNQHQADNCRLTMGEMWLEGSAGVLRLNGDGCLFWQPHGEIEHEHSYQWQNRGFAGDCVYACQAHIVAHLLGGAPLENNLRDYLRNIEIEEAVYRANAEARYIPANEFVMR